jgi:hypothetical protein
VVASALNARGWEQIFVKLRQQLSHLAKQAFGVIFAIYLQGYKYSFQGGRNFW